jgi:hypothetical protein
LRCLPSLTAIAEHPRAGGLAASPLLGKFNLTWAKIIGAVEVGPVFWGL